ncbi:hypothetical protein [Paenibacillus agilis]|uniref:Uncharacterized protein n=1 Tax=Paenibacillus agilis TaxID=3020863 RepID=A0A559ICB3_9BACL|nr:hypothetical protein [Paenibacillus agilis]TVX85264.1 hypothetical protein FPZ44_25430 [Paenibacillus agilis]
MAVSFTRPYKAILDDMSEALIRIPNAYVSLDMEQVDWEGLTPEEQKEVMEALADDLFYGLGKERLQFIGDGSIHYDRDFGHFEFMFNNETVATVGLKEEE